MKSVCYFSPIVDQKRLELAEIVPKNDISSGFHPELHDFLLSHYTSQPLSPFPPSPATTMMHHANHSHNDGASLSRATSMSRASKQGSTVSRNQSLIKKNVAPQDLRPSDILIERFVAWKAIVKQLIAYFEVRLPSPSPFPPQHPPYTSVLRLTSLLTGYRRHRE
jgi:hypothetical protein